MAKKEVIATNEWSCVTCGDKQPVMQHQEFLDHIKTVHGIVDTKGEKTLLMHMDGSNYYSYFWSWKIGGLEFTQTTVNPKRR